VYTFWAPTVEVMSVTTSCSRMRSPSETITSFEPTSCSDTAYRRSTSMDVVPRSERPRSRRITTVSRDASPTAGSAASKTGAAAKKRLP